MPHIIRDLYRRDLINFVASVEGENNDISNVTLYKDWKLARTPGSITQFTTSFVTRNSERDMGTLQEVLDKRLDNRFGTLNWAHLGVKTRAKVESLNRTNRGGGGRGSRIRLEYTETLHTGSRAFKDWAGRFVDPDVYGFNRFTLHSKPDFAVKKALRKLSEPLQFRYPDFPYVDLVYGVMRPGKNNDWRYSVSEEASGFANRVCCGPELSNLTFVEEVNHVFEKKYNIQRLPLPLDITALCRVPIRRNCPRETSLWEMT